MNKERKMRKRDEKNAHSLSYIIMYTVKMHRKKKIKIKKRDGKNAHKSKK